MGTKINQFRVNSKDYTEIVVEDDGFIVTLCDLGASIRDIVFNGKHMVASPKSFEEFITNGSYYGRTIGRTAGRIANGRFTLNKQTYQLKLNADNMHNMHGGLDGLAFKRWDYSVDEEVDRIKVRFTYYMPPMDDGFPGGLSVKVTYTIYNNKIRIDYTGTTTEDTLLNLSNHTYFNISGNLEHGVCDQVLTINANKYGKPDFTKIIENIIPITPGNPFDFTKPRKIGAKINDPKVYQITNGYDHCYVLNERGLSNRAALLVDKEANTKMSVFTTYPALVIYTCNYTDELVSVGTDKKIMPRDAICFEAQYVPNGINMSKIDKNEMGILRKKDSYLETIIYQFERIN
ncbi:MAG: galactose mutarotase [Acholeplasmatales bacterium]|nr:galactose mutarotase [Acholeplasmatales bacterium]